MRNTSKFLIIFIILIQLSLNNLFSQRCTTKIIYQGLVDKNHSTGDLRVGGLYFGQFKYLDDVTSLGLSLPDYIDCQTNIRAIGIPDYFNYQMDARICKGDSLKWKLLCKKNERYIKINNDEIGIYAWKYREEKFSFCDQILEIDTDVYIPIKYGKYITTENGDYYARKNSHEIWLYIRTSKNISRYNYEIYFSNDSIPNKCEEETKPIPKGDCIEIPIPVKCKYIVVIVDAYNGGNITVPIILK